jgi:septal ring factor EnvC (AmiA/AmiB activator)
MPAMIRARLAFLSGSLLAGMIAGIATASAQTPPPPSPIPAAPSSAEEIRKSEREKELQLIRRDLAHAHEQEARLKAEIDKLKNDSARLNKALIDSAAKISATERNITAQEAKLASLDKRESAVKQSLTGRRKVLADVLAVMQRIGAQPTPALMFAPDDALASVRAAILLGAVVPELRDEAQKLVADLEELAGLRRGILKEREDLAASQKALQEERVRIGALIGERQRQFGERQKAFEAERARTAVLAKEAETVQDLVTRLEKEIAEAAARDAKAPKIAPRVPFATTRGKLALPAAGRIVRAFGADSPGGSQKGLSLATRPNAAVNAPCEGEVVFAGPFRNYGQLLILNAGGGYHILLAGMESITVDLGQRVIAGEPVAVMGSGSKTASTPASGFSEPILYVEFRKNGVSIDPAPWWAATEDEKARG